MIFLGREVIITVAATFRRRRLRHLKYIIFRLVKSWKC